MKLTDLDLIQMQVDVLYVHDGNGRLARVNEPDAGDPVPRFFLGRTLAGNIWRVRHDLPDDLAAELERLAAGEPVAQDLRQPPHHMERYKQLLQPIGSIYSGPAYYLPELDLPDNTVTITPENAQLLQANFPYTLSTLAERSPVVVVVAEGAAVSACYSARSTAWAAEAGVYTEEGYRGRGYAADTVRGWAAATRAMGKLPLYSTWWQNTASLSAAAKLGAVLYGADFSIA